MYNSIKNLTNITTLLIILFSVYTMYTLNHIIPYLICLIILSLQGFATYCRLKKRYLIPYYGYISITSFILLILFNL